MGFGLRWRTWVKECVTTASMSVLINGSPSKPFKMERGLRQGDPLSPFLFVLVVDILHRMVGEAETEILVNYKRLLCCFELMSGLSINFEKSSLIPINCEKEWVMNMCGLLGCAEATLPVRYLGISLGANPRLVKTWKPIIDKVEDKLCLWKARTLNKAGKLVLIKSVLNSLPIYYLSLYKMPKAVAEKIIGLQRRFLWCKEDGNSGVPMVRWEVVQAPKKLGGLGVGDALIRNASLLIKWWCRFSKEDCPLWKKVVCSCNQLDPTAMLSTRPLPLGRGPWKDICQLNIKEQHIRNMMISGLAMEVGNGRRTHFWKDAWVQGGSLKDCFPRLFSVSNQQGSVIGDCGFWDGLEWVWNFQWRRELFQWELELLNQLHDRIRVVLQRETLSEDITSYSFTSSIWRGLVPPRVWCAWLTGANRAWAIPGTGKEFFESWTGVPGGKSEQRKWLTGFCAVVWNIWLEHNSRVFQRIQTRRTDVKVIQKSVNHVADAMTKFAAMDNIPQTELLEPWNEFTSYL
ncbi:uncharacterized protein [Arachis hypogaea]|uniref:uncharacterized protein n=1 Tax=Arachis hypogaea TaxID=3818 RepID=UPI0007AF2E89|nr:uncharacterized protein LOC112786452 [Arachis hypogaea]